jgi:hypothetical protein
VPHRPQDPGLPLHDGPELLAVAVDDAKTDSFFSIFVDPQWGHGDFFDFVDRTSTSLSRLQSLQ